MVYTSFYTGNSQLDLYRSRLPSKGILKDGDNTSLATADSYQMQMPNLEEILKNTWKFS